MKVLILGGTGLLGVSLANYFSNKFVNTFIHGHNSSADLYADITITKDTIQLLDRVQPDIIINLVALTNVDFCENNPNDAYLLNTKTVQNISNWIILNRPFTKLIHISSDQVYNNNPSKLAKEDDIYLTNYYAFSKFASELEANKCNGVSLRTNFFGKSFHDNRKSLSDWLVESIKHNKEINVFNDVFFNPLSMDSLCEIIYLVTQSNISGVFNLGSKNGCSKAEFAYKFADGLNFSPNSWKEVSVKSNKDLIAYRPKNMMMECKKFEKAMNIKLPSLDHEITRVIEEYYYV